MDRFLLSPALLVWFSNLIQRCLLKVLTDHNAVSLGEVAVDWGPRPFRFFNSWLEDKAMMSEALKGWKASKVKGSKAKQLFAKVKVAKVKLKMWIAEGKRVGKPSKNLEAKLVDIEVKAKQVGWTNSLREERLSVVAEL